MSQGMSQGNVPICCTPLPKPGDYEYKKGRPWIYQPRMLLTSYRNQGFIRNFSMGIERTFKATPFKEFGGIYYWNICAINIGIVVQGQRNWGLGGLYLPPPQS